MGVTRCALGNGLEYPLPRLTQEPLRHVTPLSIAQQQAKLTITGASYGYMRGLTAGGAG